MKIHFIGATAKSRLNVVIVGIMTSANVVTYSIAPTPTAMPPRHPITNMTIAIIPKRLNSDSAKNVEFVCAFIPLNLYSKVPPNALAEK